jgi:glucose/arabinose dehydrogenase
MPRASILLAVCALLVTACDGDDASESATTRRPPTTSAATTTTGSPTTTVPTPRLADVRVRTTLVADGLERPLAFAVREGDDAWYVAEQGGTVRAVRDGVVDPAPVLDLSGEVSAGNEQGLLGLAFSPDGSKLYVDFTDLAGDTHVQEFAVRDGVADPASRRELLFVDQPFGNHNGGHVVFGPDGMLYVGLGDGGSAGDPQGNAQRRSTLLGKILRIDPRPRGDAPYSVPSDNPFTGDDGARPEIWMLGLRNPWRFSFDRATGDVWIGDVGQGTWEEVDVVATADALGANWGWNAREGAHPFSDTPAPGARDPVYEYSHDTGGVAVTGGFVYRGRAIPALSGAYVFADFALGDLVAIEQRDGRLVEARPLGPHVDAVTSFGEDGDGELYVLSRGGALYRLDPA